MSLSVGIIGLPNAGKSTLFNILTGQSVDIACYPFTTIDPNVGVVRVPDEKLDKIHSFYADKKKIPAFLKFYDIAGLVKNASKGEGLGNQFLAYIREVDAVVHVVRAFQNDAVAHIEGTPDPSRDIKIVREELLLKDLETIEHRMEKLGFDSKKEKEYLAEIHNKLLAGERIDKENGLVKKLNLLSVKPEIILVNAHDNYPLDDVEYDLVVDLQNASDISDLIKETYRALEVITFYTIGDNEVQAWTIKKGAKAPEAGGVIHSDFENKFIKAEVLSYNDFLKTESWQKAKDKGLVKIKGKEYEVMDGDIIYFRHG